MLAADRPGRVAGAGFYDYEDGRRLGLWSGLDDLFGPVVDADTVDLVMLQERMLFVESLEAIRCLDEGVITSVAEANVGSILGIGYPGWTGGVLQYVNGYEGASGTGPSAFLARARDLAAAYGSRFMPPASLIEIAQQGEFYSDET
jgi:3-hydroxyacyl-CoA dehydrogenase/enoyl-CoA hydratase/3-hydroxybutyryl-CoA epimerase